MLFADWPTELTALTITVPLAGASGDAPKLNRWRHAVAALDYLDAQNADVCAIPRWLPRNEMARLANPKRVIVEEVSSGTLPSALACP